MAYLVDIHPFELDDYPSIIQTYSTLLYPYATVIIDVLPLAITKKRVLYRLFTFDLYSLFLLWSGRTCFSGFEILLSIL
ncbi:hypothetical protein BD408DRAFT_63615 [Parasitella parasitica]|nr:hypothetical protein BD408DRAFT_63615 [Parasitella parasitica]